MSSHAGSREEERRLNVRTLIIASIASAMAAIITSQFWTSGTPIAAAITPVIVTLVSELLHRPTQRIAERLTSEADAPAALDPGRQRSGRRAEARSDAPEYRVYRTSPVASRDLPWKAILVTAALAFTLAAAALTLPELIAGQSVGKGDRDFTLWGGGRDNENESSPEPGQTQPEQTQPEQTAPGSDATQPDETVPELEPQPITPAEPESTEPTPTTSAPRSGTPAPQP